MKTVAELKRAIKVGAKLASTYHRAFLGRDEQGNVIYGDEYKGIREISIVQTTQFALKSFSIQKSSQAGKDVFVDSWMGFPKREDVIFNADGSFTIQEQDDRTGQWYKIITYYFQPETASQVEFLQHQTN